MMAKVFEGIDWANGTDRGYHVVMIGPDATQEDVQAFRDAYELGCAWADAEAARPLGWVIGSLDSTSERLMGLWVAEALRPFGDWDEVVAGEPSNTPAAALRALAAKLRERAG